MSSKRTTTLHISLWVVVAIAALPAFLLALFEYQESHQRAVASITHEIQRELESARIQEQAAVRHAELVLNIMARADDLQTLDSNQCNGLAQRLMLSLHDVSNLGGVLSNGDVFCSAKPSNVKVNAADRQWFQNAKAKEGFGQGEFLIGRISGLSSIVFPFSLRNPDGSLRVALFLGSQPTWFENLLKNYQLKAGWTASLMDRSGQIIASFPNPEQWQMKQADPAVFAKIQQMLANPDSLSEFAGFDGSTRMYGLVPLASTGGELFTVIGAPVELTQAYINQQAFQRLALIFAGIALAMLFARFFIFRLIEASIGRLQSVLREFAAGNFTLRAPEHLHSREFDDLAQGLNSMAEALEKRETELRLFLSAIEQSPESVVMTDINAKIIYVNGAFTSISGYSAAEAIGQNPRILQSGLTQVETYQNLWETLKAGKIWRGELRNKRKDGSLYHEFASISPIAMPDGTVTHYVAIKQDISDQLNVAAELEAYRSHLEKLVEERTNELNLAKDAAEQANLSKSTFLANMSHEIRTPLNAILGLTHLLNIEQLSPQQHDKLKKISSSGQHLLQVINDILDLSKIEAGKFVLNAEAFSPAQTLKEVKAIISDAAQKKGLDVQLKLSQLPASVIGDSTRLRQAMLNLAGNAVKFTEQGSVTLSGEIVSEDQDTHSLCFTVEDTGPGIAEAFLPRLFTPFEQEDGTNSRQHGGTGLGLAITRHLAKMMGGEIGASSTVGKGSRFWLKIEVHRSTLGPPSNATQPKGTAEHQLAQRTLLNGPVQVLLAEDNEINSEVAVDLLHSCGCHVDWAIDGEQAVLMANRKPYDLILMDLQMPKLNGYEATDQIHQSSLNAHTPILAMTANVMPSDKTACFEHGMSDFIAKPINAEYLFATILRWLPSIVGPVDQKETQLPEFKALQVEELQTKIKQLQVFLASGDADANILFSVLEADLDHLFGQALLPLKQAIDIYDFDTASLQLAKLLMQAENQTGQDDMLGGN